LRRNWTHQEVVVLAGLKTALRENLASGGVDFELALAAARLDTVLDLAVPAGVGVEGQHLWGHTTRF